MGKFQEISITSFTLQDDKCLKNEKTSQISSVTALCFVERRVYEYNNSKADDISLGWVPVCAGLQSTQAYLSLPCEQPLSYNKIQC